jgi:hypothetical protein
MGVRHDGNTGATAARAAAGCLHLCRAAYGTAPGRGFALTLVYDSVVA